MPRRAVLYVGRVEPDPAWGMPLQRHRHHELIAVLDGGLRVTSRGRTLEAVAGDILIYPAGVEHAERTDPATPAETLFAGFRLKGLGFREVARVEDRRGRVRQAMRWLFEDRLRREAETLAQREALFRMILAEWRDLMRRGPESPLVDKTHQWVREHLGAPLNLDALARQAGLSKFHFLRQFRAATGHTPMREVRRLRLAHARDLVLGSGMPLKEIARRCGLGSAQALSRAFRQEFGAPPGALRRRG